MYNIKKDDIEQVLHLVQKPARYIGKELNQVVKEEALVRMGICYPDLYEVAMSNNGIKIIYSAVNQQKDAACERFFPVALDYEQFLREKNIPLYTLETYTPINQLDLIGYNVSHELLATNILQTLDLGGVPFRSEDRGEGDPIVIAGGEAISNPYPLWDFMDLFYFGDGEEGIVEIVALLLEAKQERMDRGAKIEMLSGVEGVLTKDNVELVYENEKLVIKGTPVRKRVYMGNEWNDPLKPLVSNIRIAQDRAVVEVARGCKNACKFCHAGYYDLPCRNYDYQTISNKITTILKNTGYNEVTLASLSISDYSDLINLINTVLPGLTENGISISFPSLKIDKQTLPIIDKVSGLRRTSLTFAVESASRYIREIVHKRVVTDDFIDIIREIFSKGWRVVKLYFMIGLPGCTEVDEAEEIIALLEEVLRYAPRRGEINVTISPFVPKPHTPFQRERQMGEDYCSHIVKKIKTALPRKVKIKNHDLNASQLEGVFSRGDTRLCDVIVDAYKKGARFDSWQEHFKYVIWEQCLDENSVDWQGYLNALDNSCELPWHIVKHGFESLVEKQVERKLDLENMHTSANYPGQEIDEHRLKSAMNEFEKKFQTKYTMRMRIQKIGWVRFVPHLDFIEIVKRALRMVSAPVVFTQGFNKREKISAGYPLPLGIESRCELLDVDFYADLPGGFIDTINMKLPDGINVDTIDIITDKRALMALVGSAAYLVKVKEETIGDNIQKNAFDKIALSKETKKGVKPIDYNSAVKTLTRIDETSFRIELYVGNDKCMRIDQLVVGLAGVTHESLGEFNITKLAQYTTDGDEI